MADLLCCCGHPGQLHVPGGGSCTAASGGCDCRAFVRRTRLVDEVPGIGTLPLWTCSACGRLANWSFIGDDLWLSDCCMAPNAKDITPAPDGGAAEAGR